MRDDTAREIHAPLRDERHSPDHAFVVAGSDVSTWESIDKSPDDAAWNFAARLHVTAGALAPEALDWRSHR